MRLQYGTQPASTQSDAKGTTSQDPCIKETTMCYETYHKIQTIGTTQEEPNKAHQFAPEEPGSKQ